MTDVDNKVKDDSLSLSPEARFNQGQIIGGKYKILSLAGKGGMGSVFRVQQIFLARDYALKTLDTRSTKDSVVLRFQNEAKAASSLSHPALVQVHDFGLLDDGQPYLVMDFVEGQSLAEYLRQHGPLDVEMATKLFAQICLGLSYAHDHGVVHRDIKPSNIMLVQNATIGVEGSAKVVDFGIAKMTTEGGEIQALTRTGEVFGSPLYMSPEQCIGAKVDHRTDVYSLGCVIFEALTGAPPHIGETALLTMMKHQSAEPQTLSQASLGRQFPEMMQNIVFKMLQKDPSARYQNLGVAAHDLAALCSGGAALSDFASAGVEALQRKTTDRSSTAPRYSALMLALTALLCSTVAGVSGYFVGSIQSQKAAPKDKAPDVHPSPFASGKGNDDVDKKLKEGQDEWISNSDQLMRENKFLREPYYKAAHIIAHPSSPDQIALADQLLQQCEKFLNSADAAGSEQDQRKGSSKLNQWRLHVALKRGNCALYFHRLSQAAEFEQQASKLEAKIPPEEKQWILGPLAAFDYQLALDYFKFGKGRKDSDKSRKYYKSALALSQSALALYKASDDREKISSCEHFIKELRPPK